MLVNSAGDNDISTFKDVSSSYERELIDNGSIGYSKLIERNCRYFTEFVKGDIFLSDITPELIEGYSRFLRNKKGIGEATNSMMMRHTKTIINKGIKRRLVKYDVHPFVNFQISTSPVREVDISFESFNRLRMADPSERRLKVAHDLFCLSFYLGGINLIDLLGIDFRGIDTLEYVRTKSRNMTRGAIWKRACIFLIFGALTAKTSASSTPPTPAMPPAMASWAAGWYCTTPGAATRWGCATRKNPRK